jgi:hypothetical protein
MSTNGDARKRALGSPSAQVAYFAYFVATPVVAWAATSGRLKLYIASAFAVMLGGMTLRIGRREKDLAKKIAKIIGSSILIGGGIWYATETEMLVWDIRISGIWWAMVGLIVGLVFDDPPGKCN